MDLNLERKLVDYFHGGIIIWRHALVILTLTQVANGSVALFLTSRLIDTKCKYKF